MGHLPLRRPLLDPRLNTQRGQVLQTSREEHERSQNRRQTRPAADTRSSIKTAFTELQDARRVLSQPLTGRQKWAAILTESSVKTVLSDPLICSSVYSQLWRRHAGRALAHSRLI